MRDVVSAKEDICCQSANDSMYMMLGKVLRGHIHNFPVCSKILLGWLAAPKAKTLTSPSRGDMPMCLDAVVLRDLPSPGTPVVTQHCGNSVLGVGCLHTCA